jgi:outer membrane protein assembly factor BamB
MMKESVMGKRSLIVLSGALLCGSIAHAQFGRGLGDFVTSGYDPQRSSWVRNEAKFSIQAMQKPGFEFLWKVKLDANTKQSFAPPILLNNYIGYRGFRSLAYVGATSNKVVALDSDLGRIEWQQQLPGSLASAACSGMMTSLTRSTTTAFPGTSGGRGGGGRGNAATSTVSEPNQGSTIYQQALARAANNPPGAPQPGRGRGNPPVPPPPGLPPRNYGVIYSLSADGMLHTSFLSSGRVAVPPTQFLPSNSNAFGLIVTDDFAYAAAAPRCGSIAESIMAVDLSTKEVFTWKPESGQVAGSAGPAVGPDGTLYVATTGGELATIEPKTLKLKATYKAGKPFASSPVVFEFKDKVLIAAATNDGRIHLLDAQNPDKAVITADAGFISDALASWQDVAGVRWILGASKTAIVAVKVVDQNGAPSVQTGWTSRSFAPTGSPTAPLIVNSVVFTVSTGSSPAVLWAFDGTTGKDLWNSGKTIAGALRGGGISIGNSQVYLGTVDGTLYAFGFPMEH